MGSSRTALRARMTAIAAVAALLAAAAAAAAPRRDAPPQTTITKAPKDRIKVRGSRTATATWEFTADQPATFTCKFTGRGIVRPCTSPITFAGLTRGRYTFTVYAINVVKSRDATRARDVVKVVKKKKRKSKHHR